MKENPLILSEKEFELSSFARNTIIFGSTGSGKTKTLH
jgi:type IV secretory pathway VirB4 component